MKKESRKDVNDRSRAARRVTSEQTRRLAVVSVTERRGWPFMDRVAIMQRAEADLEEVFLIVAHVVARTRRSEVSTTVVDWETTDDPQAAVSTGPRSNKDRCRQG
jgi:hypothetical protein